MRQLKIAYMEKNECECCVNFKAGRICPFEYCIYNEEPPKPQKRVIKAKEPEPKEPRIPTPEERRDMFPSVSIYERYKIGEIMRKAESGEMAVQIADEMKLRPQIVADIIKTLKGGEKDVFQYMRILRVKS